MENLNHYLPMMQSLASTFKTTKENKEEMVQEGLLKLFKISKEHPEYVQDFSSEDCRRRAYVIVKNCMIDYLRKIMRQSSHMADLGGDDRKLNNIKKSFPDCVSHLAIEKGIQELNEFLPYLEVRIFYEILSPSDEYCFFLRKKTAIQTINKKILRKNFKNVDKDEVSIAGFLEIPEERYRVALERIKKFISRYPTIFTKN